MRATTLLLSLLPLASCISGYILSVYYFSKPSCEVPQLAGLSLAQALIRVGQKELTLKILSEKHEPHAKPGTILMQKPAAGMRLKQHFASECMTCCTRGFDQNRLATERAQNMPVRRITRHCHCDAVSRLEHRQEYQDESAGRASRDDDTCRIDIRRIGLAIVTRDTLAQ